MTTHHPRDASDRRETAADGTVGQDAGGDHAGASPGGGGVARAGAWEPDQPRPPGSRLLQLVRGLGPGLVSGASDVDPTTVGSIAVIGATTGFALSWLALLVLPLLAVIQLISAHVGAVGSVDLQKAVARRYGKSSQMLLLVSVLGVTIVTLGADLQAGAAALGLLVHMQSRWLIGPLAGVVIAILLLGRSDELQRWLKYVMLVLGAYVFAAFLAHPNWGLVARDSFLPPRHWAAADTAGALALAGTTITSYVYIWQTIDLCEQPRTRTRRRLWARQVDALSGTVFAVALFWFILIATGATLGPRHVTVNTAQQAAQALTPIAGSAASLLFGIGLLASAVVALPILMATSAYVVGSQFNWRRGLSERITHAWRFYLALFVAVGLGVAVDLLGVPPIRLLFLASLLGGLGTPIGLVYLLLVASDRGAMYGRPIGRTLKIAGWLTTLGISAISVVYLVQQFG